MQIILLLIIMIATVEAILCIVAKQLAPHSRTKHWWW